MYIQIALIYQFNLIDLVSPLCGPRWPSCAALPKTYPLAGLKSQ